MGCTDSRARPITPINKLKIIESRSQQKSNNSEEKKSKNEIESKNFIIEYFEKKKKEEDRNSKSIGKMVKQLNEIRNSVALLENSIRDMRLKQIQLNSSTFKKKRKDLSNIKKSINDFTKFKRKSCFNLRNTVDLKNKNKGIFKKIESNHLSSFLIQKNIKNSPNYRIRKTKSLLPKTFTEDIFSSSENSSYHKTLVKLPLNTYKNSISKSKLKKELKNMFKSSDKHKKVRNLIESNTECNEDKSMSILERKHNPQIKKRKGEFKRRKNVFKEKESSTSIISYPMNPFEIKKKEKSGWENKKEKYDKPKPENKTIDNVPVTIDFVKNSFKKKRSKSNNNIERKTTSQDFLQRYDKNLERNKKKIENFQKLVESGEIQTRTVIEKDIYKKEFGKLYGGVIRKKAEKKYKDLFMDNSLKDINTSKGRSSTFFFSPNISTGIRRLPTPKIPVSYFSKSKIEKTGIIERRRKSKLNTVHLIRNSARKRKSTIGHINQKNKISFSNALEYPNLQLKMNQSLQKTPTHGNLNQISLKNAIMKDKEQALERALNKSKIHNISIENSPSEIKIKLNSKKEKKMILNQMASLFKKMNYESDESKILSSIRKISSKKIIKERSEEEQSDEEKEKLINPYSSEEEIKSKVESVVGGSEDNTLKSDVTMTVILDKTIDAEGNESINQYLILGLLGKGAFGEVKKVKSMKDKQIYAMKIVNIQALERKNKHSCLKEFDFKQEIELHKKINHKNVVKVIEVIDNYDDVNVYIILEYAKWGALCSKKFWKGRKQKNKSLRILQEQGEELSVEEIKGYFSQLILALDYLHLNMRIAHRDIKPDNILIMENNTLKLADFGVSQCFKGKKTDLTTLKIGTVAFHPPEAIENEEFNAFPCDIWASGCLLYYLIFKEFPFKGKNRKELEEKITEAKFDLPFEIDKNLKHLLTLCLTKDPLKRASTSCLLKNKWLFPNKFSKMNTLAVF